MESKSLINPFSLLGVKTSSTISELKKNYYQLSLLTHPDKGGSPEDFQTVHLAYSYIKEQLEGVKDVSYEELEDEFQQFCQYQKDKPKPTFYDVNIEANDWLNQFNSKFEKTKKQGEQGEQELNEHNDEYNNNLIEELHNPFTEGYGGLMDPSEISLDSFTEELNPDWKFPTQEELQDHQGFNGEIIPYEEPEFLPNYVKYLPLHKIHIQDFSTLEGNLHGSDYKLAHTDIISSQKSKDLKINGSKNKITNLEEKIKELGNHPQFNKYPEDYIIYNPSIFN